MPLFSVAQTPRVDSLKASLAGSRDSLSGLRTLLALCNERESLAGDTISQYAHRARGIAAGLHDQPHLLLANYYILLSLVTRGYTDSVLSEDERILKTLSYDGERDLYVRYSIQLARVYIKKARYKEAQSAIFLLLDKAEKAHDESTTIYCLTYIGWTYMEMEQLPVALEWLHRALERIGTNQPELDLASLYYNTASVLNDLGRRDSAWYYVRRAIVFSERHEKLVSLANSLAIQSDIYVGMGRIAEATASMDSAVRIRRLIGDPFYILSDMGALASLYSRDNKTTEGIRLCQEGIVLARRYRFLPKELYLNEALAENYKAAGDYKNLSLVQQQILLLKDSLYHENSNQALADLQGRYESQRQARTIIEQKYNLVRKNNTIVVITALFLLSLATGVIIFEVRRHRQTRRLKEVELEGQRRRLLAIDQTREEERKRILADLHDELGSGLSSIRIMSDLMVGQAQDAALVTRYSEKISDISRDTSRGMNTIIWALNNENDSIRDLGEYIGRLGEELFEEGTIVFQLVLGGALPTVQLGGAVRKNLFLCVKESLHNVLKHSGAQSVRVEIGMEEGRLVVTVADDGVGAGQKEGGNRWGNGLKNITRRMTEIGGRAEIQQTSGFCVRLEVPVG